MKKHLILVAVVICLLPSFTFSQVIEWQNTIGGSGDDKLHSMQQTVDGGYILGGWSISDISGDKTENSNGNYDYWIVKTDNSGIIQWQNTIGGSGYDALYSIKQTTDGGYIFGGQSSSNISGDKTENTNGYYDYWVVKTDSSGNIQWQNTIGGTENDYLTSVYQTADGGYILGGSSLSNISGDKIEICNGGHDYWIVKIDTAGNIQWQNTIGGNSNDYLRSVEQTADGGYILCGYSSSNISGDKAENSNGLHDYWIVKTDPFGVILWQNNIGGSGDEYLHSLVQTSDGGYIFGGWSKSNISGDKTENSNGVNDYWIVKTDALGIIQWQNSIGGSGYDELYSIKQASDGGFILGGFSGSNISGDKTENCNVLWWDYWIVKTDESGVIQWQNNIGGNDSELLNAVCVTSDGGYILGGGSASNLSGDKTENNNGSNDIWIVKISEHTNLISGKLFIDSNVNNSQDVGEPAVLNKKVTEAITSGFGFSGPNGKYNVSVFDSGNYSVSPALINYYNIVPVSHSVTFTGIQQTDSLNDFAFQSVGVFNDMCVAITPLGPFRAGFNASYLITYENVGTTTLNPTVIFFPDDNVSFISAIPVANTVAIDSLVWNFGPISPFQTGSILVTVNVATGTPIGTLINSGAVIEPIAGDANTSCNYSFWEVFTTGSYDPNDILVNEDTLLTTQFPNPPYLEYLIRFQNTGNDTAFTVKILNPIDTFKLELSSLEFVASSHPVNFAWIPWERNMEFRFENILLPDSNVNEPASHGFVRYRIKPKSTLTVGNSITNYAAIYFDFNVPVITNTVVTQIMLPTGIASSNPGGGITLAPNPAKDVITVSFFPSKMRSELAVYDLLGRAVHKSTIHTPNSAFNIDISDFSNGVYFLRVISSEKIYCVKFIKQ